ncbi:MAG: family transposase [Hyphomicrobiales bacterium]|nr:family transposase [Hyphomicrobiales bacterium]
MELVFAGQLGKKVASTQPSALKMARLGPLRQRPPFSVQRRRTHTPLLFPRPRKDRSLKPSTATRRIPRRIFQVFVLSRRPISVRCADECRAFVRRRRSPSSRTRTWVRQELTLVSRKSKLAEAIRCPLSRWVALTRFIEGGRIETDYDHRRRLYPPIARRKKACFAGSYGAMAPGRPRLAGGNLRTLRCRPTRPPCGHNRGSRRRLSQQPARRPSRGDAPPAMVRDVA